MTGAAPVNAGKSTEIPENTGTHPASPPPAAGTQATGEPKKECFINLDWFDETMNVIHWKVGTLKSWMKTQHALDGVNYDLQTHDMLTSLSKEQAIIVYEKLKSMRESAGK